MDLAWFASTVAFAVSMSASPGPNNTMLTASGAAWGFRRTLPHMAGITVGFPVMLLAVSLGAGEVLRSRPWLQDGMRWAGSAYLLWLAWHIAFASTAKADHARPAGGPLGFGRAALFQWVNPTAWVIAAGAVVTYTSATGPALVAQAATIALIFLATSVPSTACWTLAGVGAARLLRTPRAQRWFNRGLAGLLVASLIPLLRGE